VSPIRAFATGALVATLVAVFIALFWSSSVDQQLAMLADSAAASRAASHLADSVREAERLADHVAHVQLEAEVLRLTRTARVTGQQMLATADTLWREAPDTCIPGIARLRLGMVLHLAADSVKDEGVTRMLRADSLALDAERSRTFAVMAERDTAQNRLDRAIKLGQRSDWTVGPHLGYGLSLVDGRVVDGWQAGISVQRRIRLKVPFL